MPVTIDDPDLPLGTHVFTAMEVTNNRVASIPDFLDMYACARVMGSYISNGNVCTNHGIWFNDDRCTLPKNWTRML